MARGCRLLAPWALLPEGWARDVMVAIDVRGRIASVTPGATAGNASPPAAPATTAPRVDAHGAGAQAVDAPAAHASEAEVLCLPGPLLPGMPNLHSHAFQRAIAGTTGAARADGDSFWAWRERMYAFVDRLDPEALEAIAAQLQVELLEAGYTSVAEFHYLHHDRAGRPYANPAETSERVAAAAAASGIGLTLLPVFYAHAGFGGLPPTAAQRRFTCSLDAYLGLVDRLRAQASRSGFAVGVAPHSLRAATPGEVAAVAEYARRADPGMPIHIHLAEQQREVEDCLAWSGRRPIEWLLAEGGVDRQWCLVHCTQATVGEARALAESGCVVGLCPTTEADLGDGIFPAPEYLRAGGRIGIGSDSHVATDPFAELRLLEYGQRLVAHRRNVLAGAGEQVGRALWERSLDGGAAALGRDCGRIAPGALADLVVLDGDSPALAALPADALLEVAVFGPARTLVREVYVAGRRVVADGRHSSRAAIAGRYRRAMHRLAVTDGR